MASTPHMITIGHTSSFGYIYKVCNGCCYPYLLMLSKYHTFSTKPVAILKNGEKQVLKGYIFLKQGKIFKGIPFPTCVANLVLLSGK